MQTWDSKDPDEVLDYAFDWSPRGLGDDTIITTTAAIVSGDMVVDSHAVEAIEDKSGNPVATGQGTVTWLSGGTDGTTSLVLLHAETTDGRVLEETIKIKCKTR